MLLEVILCLFHNCCLLYLFLSGFVSLQESYFPLTIRRSRMLLGIGCWWPFSALLIIYFSLLLSAAHSTPCHRLLLFVDFVYLLEPTRYRSGHKLGSRNHFPQWSEYERGASEKKKKNQPSSRLGTFTSSPSHGLRSLHQRFQIAGSLTLSLRQPGWGVLRVACMMFAAAGCF